MGFWHIHTLLCLFHIFIIFPVTFLDIICLETTHTCFGNSVFSLRVPPCKFQHLRYVIEYMLINLSHLDPITQNPTSSDIDQVNDSIIDSGRNFESARYGPTGCEVDPVMDRDYSHTKSNIQDPKPSPQCIIRVYVAYKRVL